MYEEDFLRSHSPLYQITFLRSLIPSKDSGYRVLDSPIPRPASPQPSHVTAPPNSRKRALSHQLLHFNRKTKQSSHLAMPHLKLPPLSSYRPSLLNSCRSPLYRPFTTTPPRAGANDNVRVSSNDDVRIIEVGPRDGLQNESVSIPLKTKIELIERLARTGVRNIEAGSFVKGGWVPQVCFIFGGGRVGCL